MPEKLDPRILPIWEQEQQLEQRHRPKPPISRERYQEAAEKQKQEMAVHFSNADSKQKPLQQESDVFSYVKANYVDRGKCKCFHRFLECITHGDKVLQERFWQFLRYVLLQTNEAKAFFIMGTAPNSGKSALGNFIESLFDSRYASSIALNDLNKNFSFAPSRAVQSTSHWTCQPPN